VKLLLMSLEELPTYAPTYRFLAASYAHLGRLDEARTIVARFRRIAGDVETNAGRWFRNADHRELILSGLRLATGEEHGVLTATPGRPPQYTEAIQHGEAERRQITALYCELVGAAPQRDGVGLEDLREAAGGFHRCVSEAAARHQGFVYRDLGNSALVLFGYPEAHEHDAEQAIRAGLELCAAVRTMQPDADVPVRCRVGIATGMVIVGDPVRTGATRGESLVGDAPNLAARLSLSAEADTVAIEPSTRRLIGNLFDCRELGSIETAGGNEPIRRWQVLGESAVESRFGGCRR
jgi:class 3 adenylate cyclase